MTRQEVFIKAIKHYGIDSQIGVAQEECAELIQALSKFLRNDMDMGHIAEEMADVEIMLEQLKLIFNNRGVVEKYKDFKTQRLLERINAEDVR